MHQLTFDIARASVGESQDGPVRQGRQSYTDEAGYVVPVDESPKAERRSARMSSYSEPYTSGETTKKGEPLTDEFGYSCPNDDSPDYNVLEESKTHNSNSRRHIYDKAEEVIPDHQDSESKANTTNCKETRNSRRHIYDEAEQVIPDHQDHESKTNSNSQKSRRRPPSPPRKIGDF